MPSYGRNARDDARHSAPRQRRARRPIAGIGPEGAESLPDIDCGDGKIAAELAQRPPPPAKHPKFRFRRGDASRLPFRARIRTTRLPHTQRVPAARRSAFISDVVDACARCRPPDVDGSIRGERVRLEVAASKGDP